MFLETICIVDGVVKNPKIHVERMKRTASYFKFIAPTLPELACLLPVKIQVGKVKCRILYHETIREVTFERYRPKKVESLKLIEASPDYTFKYSDRRELNELMALKGECDEILVVRNGFVTDTSYSNVVLRRGNELVTPSDPLLNGTKRQKLLQEGIIKEKRIHKDSLPVYDRLYLINAILDLEDEVSLPINALVG